MRKILLFLIVITTSVVFILRLFYLQVYASEPYSIYEDNAIRKVLTYPKRGYIYDRNNNLLVSNQPSYDVMIIPGLVKEIDTLEFCDLLKYDNISSKNIENNFDLGSPSKINFEEGVMKYAYNWREGGQFSIKDFKKG